MLLTLLLAMLCVALAAIALLLALRKPDPQPLSALAAQLTQLRRELADETARRREAEAHAHAAEAQVHAALRLELTTRLDHTLAQQATLRDALTQRLHALSTDHATRAEHLRDAVRASLDRLNTDNAARLEHIRLTVDEKLHATLHTRLTESFGQVTENLARVHQGLGEMNSLSAGVRDLSRLFANVKTRGGWAEIGLGRLLEQVLAPGQFLRNTPVRPGTQECVEFAVRFPGHASDVLLAIDAKFPRESWDRLETAYEQALTGPPLEAAQRAFDLAVRTEARRIASKYIHEPHTTPYAILFLPTEGLYAEVLRRDGLQPELHAQHRILVAGPSTLYALLTSFQLGFRMLNLQRKGDEVWRILGETKAEFTKFAGLMDKAEKQVGTIQNTLGELGTRTRAIQRKLHDVAEAPAALPTAAPSAFDGHIATLTAEADPL